MLSQQLQEQNKALVRRFIEESGNVDPTAYQELMAPDFVAHLAFGPQDRAGIPAAQLGVYRWRSARSRSKS